MPSLYRQFSEFFSEVLEHERSLIGVSFRYPVGDPRRKTGPDLVEDEVSADIERLQLTERRGEGGAGGGQAVGDPRRKLRPDIVEDDSRIPVENITSSIQLIDLIEREGDYTVHEAEVMKTTYETLRVIDSMFASS